ncbi:LptM family lipoprotein [Castellaniella caeni]|uniref:LptM family lipoprotein n=1 Tax=Castellaniella caeni TaxID=266123 RepID=UPI00083759BF|nr:hypothetical protein [Castellaniella caeni]
MKRIYRILAVVVCALGLAACQQTVPLQQTQTATIHARSLTVVKDAIIQAGLERGWMMKPVSSGVIDGKLLTRDHEVQVRIAYGTSSYQIDYVDSRNMKAANGKIHRKYGQWVRNLDIDIQRRLALSNSN